MNDYKQQAYDIHDQIMDGVEWIDGNPASPDQMRAYIETGLQAAHAAGVAAERARVVGLIEVAQRKQLMTTAMNMGEPIAAANALEALLNQVRQ